MRLYVGKGMHVSGSHFSPKLWEGFLTSHRDAHTLNMR